MNTKEIVKIAPKGYENSHCELEMTFTLEGSQKFVEFGKQYLLKEKDELELLLVRTWLCGESEEGIAICEQEMNANIVRVEMPQSLWESLRGFGKELMNQRLLDIAEMRERDWENSNPMHVWK